VPIPISGRGKTYGWDAADSPLCGDAGIKETLDAGMISPFDPESSRKYMKYIPWWGK